MIGRQFNTPLEFDPNALEKIKLKEKELDASLGLASLSDSCSDVSDDSDDMSNDNNSHNLFHHQQKNNINHRHHHQQQQKNNINNNNNNNNNKLYNELKDLREKYDNLINEHDKNLNNLRKQMNEKNNLMRTHKTVVKRLQNVIEEQKYELNENDEIMEALNSRIDTLEKRIKNTHNNVNDKNNNSIELNEAKSKIAQLETSLMKLTATFKESEFQLQAKLQDYEMRLKTNKENFGDSNKAKTLEVTIEKQKVEIRKQNETIKSLKDIINTLKQEKEQTNQSIDEVKNRYQKEIDDYKQQLKSMDNVVNELNELKLYSKNQNNDKEQLYSKLKGKMIDLKQELTVISEKYENSQSELDNNTIEINQLKQQLAEYETKSNNASKDRTNEINELQQQLSKCESVLESKDNKIKELQQQLADYETKYNNASKDRTNEINELQQQLSKCESVLESKDNKMKELQQQLNEYETKSNNASKDNTNKLNDLQQQLAECESVLESKDNEIDTLNKQLAEHRSEYQNTVENKNNELESLRKELHNITIECDEKVNVIKELKINNEELLENVKNMKDEIESKTLLSTQNMKTFAAQCSMLNENIENLTKQLVDKCKEVEKVQLCLENTEKENKSLESALKRSEQIEKVLESKVQEYSESIESKQSDIDNFKQQLVDYENKYNILNNESQNNLQECKKWKAEYEQKNATYELLKVKVKEKMMSATAQYNKLKTEYQKAKTLCKQQVATIHNLQEKHSNMYNIMNNNINQLKTGQMNLKKFVKFNLNSMLTDSISNYDILLTKMNDRQQQLINDYVKEMKERKRLFNLVQELKGNIRVFCRVRPLLNNENETKSCVSFPSEGSLNILDPNKSKANKYNFDFEQVFEPDKDQSHVFNHVKDLVTSVLDGYNVCIFAYGQTGSGKTFTMEGPPDNRGINFRAIKLLFEKCDNDHDIKHEIKVQIIEIYCEEIRDLLAKRKAPQPKLKIIKSIDGGTEIAGVNVVSVETADDVFKLTRRSKHFRATGCTDMNQHSSRSHLVVSIFVESTNILTRERYKGKLHLIDLAGSERVGRSGVTGQSLQEAKKINYSLSALGNCINARSNNKSHVPYRDSKLTSLLQDSLEKNSKTLMVVQVSPNVNDLGETLCSLRFAEHARKVELGKAIRNKSTSSSKRSKS